MPHSITLLHRVLPQQPLPGLGDTGPQHAIGIAEGFGLLVLAFGTVLGLMIVIGHLRHQRRSRG